MVIQIHNGAKPVLPRRTLAFSVLLLALTSMLAADLTGRRAGDPLGPTLTPDGWNLSFRPPKRFVPGDAVRTRIGDALLFYGPLEQGAAEALAIWRINEGIVEGADGTCTLLLGQFGSPSPDAAPISGGTSNGTPLGPLPAAERISRERTTVARAVVLATGEIHAVSLQTQGAVINDQMYRLFDLTCRSIEYASSK